VGQTFNVNEYYENKKARNQQIKNLIDILTNFLTCKDWKAGEELCDLFMESALLPLLESIFRSGSYVELTKESEVTHSYLGKMKSFLLIELTRAIAGQKTLVKCLVEIDPRYKPTQMEPIYKLLGRLGDLADIFLNCLNQQQNAEG